MFSDNKKEYKKGGGFYATALDRNIKE